MAIDFKIIIIAVLLAILGVLAICIIVTRMRTKPEVGTIFRNPLYGLYYIGDKRIDQSVVEVKDTNNMYNADNSEVTIEDANPDYAGGSADTAVEVDNQGYARITGLHVFTLYTAISQII